MEPARSNDPVWFSRLQRALLQVCICFLFLAIVVELVELVYAFGRAVATPADHGGRLLISKAEAGNIVPLFLGMLISLELIETLRSYLHDHDLKIQYILLVGLTAITRHLLAADLAHGEPLLNLSLAALIVALGTTYFLIQRTVKPRLPA